MKRATGDIPFREAGAVNAISSCSDPSLEQPQEDPLRRFTLTPHSANLPVMGRSVRLETNSPRILENMVELFTQYPVSPEGQSAFTWRIVSQSDVHMSPPWPRRYAFSDQGIRFAEFGGRNFLAVDLEARTAIAFISEGLVEDTAGFSSPFVDTLFYMTAGALRLVPFAAACVAMGSKGLLVLGSPNQGKTTASYLAAQSGLTYYADQAVFLEIVNGQLRAWGDFVPAAFRPESLHFLPELEPITRQLSYCDFNFHYLSKHKTSPQRADFVSPICCVVLERESASAPQLVPLERSDFSSWLSAGIPFEDDDRFDGQRLRALEALAKLPAYHLAYGSNPASAAPFFGHLLAAHAIQTHRMPHGG